MKKLMETKKITLATLKSFARRNEGKIYAKTVSEFDGMTDCVEQVKGEFKLTELKESNYYRSGINGIYTVGDSRDYFSLYNDGEFFGIKVYNSCGTSILAVKI